MSCCCTLDGTTRFRWDRKHLQGLAAESGRGWEWKDANLHVHCCPFCSTEALIHFLLLALLRAFVRFLEVSKMLSSLAVMDAPNVRIIRAPVTVVGDIHGQFHDRTCSMHCPIFGSLSQRTGELIKCQATEKLVAVIIITTPVGCLNFRVLHKNYFSTIDAITLGQEIALFDL